MCSETVAYFIFNFRLSSISNFNPPPHFLCISSLCILQVPVVVVPVGHSWALLPNSLPASPLSLPSAQACLSPASLPQPTRAVPSCSLRDQSAPPPGPFSHIPLLGRGYISSQALPALALLCVSAPQPRQQRQAEEEEGDW